MRDADQLIAGALRDIAAEAGPPGPLADAAWRAGRRRRAVTVAAAAASIVSAIALALAIVLPQTPAPSPAAASPPTRLVSITLSPATPASTSALTAVAQLLRERAAYLHLPDTQIQIIGPNVLVIGPAADRAQLKAIAMPGVLNLRQVLLYQSPGGTAYGDANLVTRQTLALFRKLACTPGNTGTWQEQVGYVAAEDYDNPYTQIVVCDGSGNKYALDVAYVRGTQLSSVAAGPSGTSSQWVIWLTLNNAGASAFGALTAQMYAKYYAAAAGNPATNDFWLDTVAAVVDGNVIDAPEVLGPIPGGHLEIAGDLPRAQVEELAAQLHFGALPADFRITAISAFSVPSSPSAAS